MNHKEKIQEALRRGDFYELALLTYEGDTDGSENNK